MNFSSYARRVPWLVTLLVGCSDDGVSAADGTTTGDSTGEMTMSTTIADESSSTTMSTTIADESSSTTMSTTAETSSEGPTSSEGTSTGDNAVPDAVDDTYFTTQNIELPADATAGVSANDNDADGDALEVTAFDAMSLGGGTVDVSTDGSFVYTPAAGFWGPDSFGYTVEDGIGGSDSATVTVFVAPVQIPLGDVTAGAGGFVLNGETAFDRSGRWVSGAGDVNGDGMDDIIVGAYGADPNGDYAAGRSYVVFGKADTTAVELSMLGAGGFALDGETAYDYSGTSVSGAGDVNGDGLDDLIVGASGADLNGEHSGRSYVVFGVPTADNCCGAHTLSGCTDAVFEACVCDLDAFCCDVQWDATCVGQATDDCGACG